MQNKNTKKDLTIFLCPFTYISYVLELLVLVLIFWRVKNPEKAIIQKSEGKLAEPFERKGGKNVLEASDKL